MGFVIGEKCFERKAEQNKTTSELTSQTEVRPHSQNNEISGNRVGMHGISLVKIRPIQKANQYLQFLKINFARR